MFRSSESPPDPLLFEQLTFPHLRALHSFARRLVSEPRDAEDLVQETYLRAFRAFSRFEPGTNVRAWLFRILRNALVSEYRRRRAHPETRDADADDDGETGQVETIPAPGNAENVAGRAFVGEAIDRALAALPDEHRMVVLLCLVEGFTYAEAAEALDIPIGTVMSRLHRGRRILQRLLREEGRALGLRSDAAEDATDRATTPRAKDAE